MRLLKASCDEGAPVTVGRYRKKPVEIEAVLYGGENLDEVAAFIGQLGKVEKTKLPGPGRGMHDGLVIRTLGGNVTASVGDWIIRDARGEYRPCKPGVFADAYERVDGADTSCV